MRTPTKNTRVVFALAILVGVMLGIVSQAAPIYRYFCAKTGYGGTTQTTTQVPSTIQARTIIVDFDSNVDSALPWDFVPMVRSMTVNVGEENTVLFRAANHGSKTVVGTAVHNVQPDKAGLYFTKTQCFCFSKQTLKPGQSDDMPVKFYIDPSIANDHNLDDLKHITLSYTFYPTKKK
jgi:cytochrome c oxidase assembly protein subunit 11